MIAGNIPTIALPGPLLRGADFRAPTVSLQSDNTPPAIASEPLSLSSAEPFKEVEGLENLRETLTRFFDQIFRNDDQRDQAVDNVLNKLIEARQPPFSQEETVSAQFSLRMTSLEVSYANEDGQTSFSLSQSVLEIQARIESSTAGISPQVFDLNGEAVKLAAEELEQGRKMGYYSRKNIMKDLGEIDGDARKAVLNEAKKVMDELKAFTSAMKDYRKTGNADVLKPFFEMTV